ETAMGTKVHHFWHLAFSVLAVEVDTGAADERLVQIVNPNHGPETRTEVSVGLREENRFFSSWAFHAPAAAGPVTNETDCIIVGGLDDVLLIKSTQCWERKHDAMKAPKLLQICCREHARDLKNLVEAYLQAVGFDVLKEDSFLFFSRHFLIFLSALHVCPQAALDAQPTELLRRCPALRPCGMPLGTACRCEDRTRSSCIQDTRGIAS